MRALVIGFGSVGRRHARNLRALCDPLELILLRREAISDTATRELEAQVVESLGAALATQPDFAVVATPSGQHVDVLLPLLEAGIACYVEKPVVAQRGDLERLRALLVRVNAPPITHAGCNLRHLPSLARLRQLLSEGAIGTVVRASFQAGQWLPDWRPTRDYRASYSADRSMGGGVILDLIHEIDAARWFFGSFDKVVAMAGKFSSLEISSEDTACLVLGKEKGGPLVAISLDYVSRRRIRRYEFEGENGTLVWDLKAGRLELISCDRIDVIECGDEGFDVSKTYVTAMTEFLEGVRHNRATSQDIFEGMQSVDLALRAREAAGV